MALPPRLPGQPDTAKAQTNDAIVVKLLLGALGLVLVLIAVAVVLGFVLLRQVWPGGEVDLGATDRWQGVAEAYAEGNGASHPDAPALRLFLTEAMVDSDRFAAAVDRQAFTRRLKASGQLSLMAWLQAAPLRPQLAVPVDCTELRVAHLEQEEGEGDWLAYTWAWDAYGNEWRLRWWLSHESSQWQIRDWEILGFGVPGSFEAALIWADGPDMEPYHMAGRFIHEADVARSDGDRAEASRCLTAAGALQVPKALQAVHALEVAYGWSRLGDYEQALEWYVISEQRGMAPGAMIGQASVWAGEQEWEEAELAASRFEDLMGPGVEVCTILAECREAADDEVGAQMYYRTLLRAKPNHTDALEFLVRQLTIEQLPELTVLMEATDDPRATAFELATELEIGNHIRALQVVMAYLGTNGHARHPDYLVLLARVLAGQGRDEAAANTYQQAMTAYTGDVVESAIFDPYYDFIDFMTLRGKLTDGYRQAPDGEAYLTNVMWLWEDDELQASAAELQTVIAEFAGQSPDNPRGPYWLGELALARREAATALVHYQQAQLIGERQDADEELMETIQTGIRTCQILKGEWQAHYEGGEALQLITNLMINYQATEHLAAVIEHHQKAQPDDPSLLMSRAMLASEQGRLVEALNLLADFLASGADQIYLVRYRLNDILDRADCPWPLPEVYLTNLELRRLVVENLLYAEDWQRLGDILATIPVTKQQVVEFRVAVLRSEALEDHQRVAELLQPWPAAFLESLREWEALELLTAGVESLIAQARYDQAMTLAGIAQTTYDDPYLLLVVFLALEDREQFQATLAEVADSSLVLARLLEHPKWGDQLRDPAWRSLYHAQALSSSLLEGGTAVVVFLEAPASLTSDAVLEAARTSGWTEPSLRAFTTADGYAAWQVNSPQGTIVITQAEGHYWPTPPWLAFLEASYRQPLEEHRGWLAIQWRDVPDSVKPAMTKRFSRLVGQLLPSDAVVLGLRDHYAVVRVDPQLRNRLRAGVSLRQLATNNFWYLYRMQPLAAQVAEQRIRHSLYDFVDRFEHRQADEYYEVQFEVGGNLSRETVWAVVRKIEDTVYGRQYEVELVEDIPQAPAVRQGMKLTLSADAVINWRLTDAQGQQTGDGWQDQLDLQALPH